MGLLLGGVSFAPEEVAPPQVASVRLVRYGWVMTRIVPLEERFWARVKKSDGCWEWAGTLRPNGYGVVSPGRRGATALYVHRLSWALAFGPVPAGLCVCHRCDNRKCVRPDHLFLGTQGDNLADMRAKGRQARGERHGMKLHPEARTRGDAHWSRTPEGRLRAASHLPKRPRKPVTPKPPRGLHWTQTEEGRARVSAARTGVSVNKGEVNGSAKLTAADVARAREMRGAGRLLREIAAALGVAEGTVSRALSGRNWGHLSPSGV